jgi:predicted transcriptional regulator
MDKGSKQKMSRRFLNNFFSCHSKIDILRTIINSDEPQSGRQIAARAGLSPRSCQLSLDELVKLNALNRTASGKAYFYTVNLENQIITDLIIPIIQQEERLTQGVVESLRVHFGKKVNGVRGIYFLESWPRNWGGKGDSARLLAVSDDGRVRSKLKEKLESALEMMLSTFGMPADYLIMTSKEFAGKVLEKPDTLEMIQQRLKDVSGLPFAELVEAEKGGPEHLEKAVNFFPRRSGRAR